MAAAQACSLKHRISTLRACLTLNYLSPFAASLLLSATAFTTFYHKLCYYLLPLLLSFAASPVTFY